MPVHANYILRTGDRVEVAIEETGSSLAEPVAGEVDVRYEDDALMILEQARAPGLSVLFPKRGPGAGDFPDGQVRRWVCIPAPEPVRQGNQWARCAPATKRPRLSIDAEDAAHGRLPAATAPAVVCGRLEGSGVVDAPIAKEDAASVRRVVDFEKGKPAVTRWESQGTFGDYSLVRLTLETGPTPIRFGCTWPIWVIRWREIFSMARNWPVCRGGLPCIRPGFG